MTAQTSAGTTIGIAQDLPLFFSQAGFTTLAYSDIGEVTDITGEIGRSYNLASHNALRDRATRKYKGAFNSGSLQLALALDQDDAGQLLALSALYQDRDYAFRVMRQDGSALYFCGKVMSFPSSPGGVDNIDAGSIGIEITANEDGNDFVDEPGSDDMTPFSPKPSGTRNVAGTTSSDRVQLLTDSEYPQVELFNDGTGKVFVEFGDATVTASTTTSKPIGPGVHEVLTPLGTHMAVITASGTATVYATAGKGI